MEVNSEPEMREDPSDSEYQDDNNYYYLPRHTLSPDIHKTRILAWSETTPSKEKEPIMEPSQGVRFSVEVHPAPSCSGGVREHFTTRTVEKEQRFSPEKAGATRHPLGPTLPVVENPQSLRDNATT